MVHIPATHWTPTPELPAPRDVCCSSTAAWLYTNARNHTAIRLRSSGTWSAHIGSSALSAPWQASPDSGPAAATATGLRIGHKLLFEGRWRRRTWSCSMVPSMIATASAAPRSAASRGQRHRPRPAAPAGLGTIHARPLARPDIGLSGGALGARTEPRGAQSPRKVPCNRIVVIVGVAGNVVLFFVHNCCTLDILVESPFVRLVLNNL